MTEAFSTRLFAKIDQVSNPAMVGLDPRLDQLPEPFTTLAAQGPQAASDALIHYHRELLDVLQGRVAVIKPQAAFFETLGPAGMHALADAVKQAKERGFIVVMDAKRGDIGSTSAAYAQAYFSNEVFPASDALTINPYLGEDACAPFVEAAEKYSTGLFILVKTSNPGAGLFQDLASPTVAEQVADAVVRWGEQVQHDQWSSVGAVVGATRPEELAAFRARMPKVPLLLPGFGFQGGGADGLEAAFDAKGHGAVVNSSRGILFAHQREDLAHLPDWQARTEVAVDEMVQALREVQRLAACATS